MIYNNSQIKNERIITIPNSVTEIENYTGSNNPNIIAVIIPESVKSIRNGAFSECANLNKVVFEHNIDNKICNGSRIFYNCPNLEEVYFADFDTFDSYSYDSFGPLENGSKLYIAEKQVTDLIIPKIQDGQHQILRNLKGAKEINKIRFYDGDKLVAFKYEYKKDYKNYGSVFGLTKQKYIDTILSKYRRMKILIVTKIIDTLNDINEIEDIYHYTFYMTKKSFENLCIKDESLITRLNKKESNYDENGNWSIDKLHENACNYYKKMIDLDETLPITEDMLDEWTLTAVSCKYQIPIDRLKKVLLGTWKEK